MMYWFWTVFVGIVLLWYIIVTTLVGYKGAQDIREMFKGVTKPEETDEP